jgi:hypothetical protein
MAATNIPFDRSNQFGQELKALLNAYRKAVTDGPIILEAMSHMVDGDGTDAAHFTELVTLGIFETTADAKASWDELQSANAKVTTDNSVTNVKAALLQVCAKHGII